MNAHQTTNATAACGHAALFGHAAEHGTRTYSKYTGVGLELTSRAAARGMAAHAVLTFALLCLTIMIDRADMQLLPSVYLEVCREFNAGPAMLGLVTFWRGMVQALVAACAGPLGKRFDRVRVVAVGCALWGIASAMVGAARTTTDLLLARAFNGVGIGIVIPVTQALVSDLAPERLRGRAFGVLGLFATLGGMAGAFFATELAGYDQDFGWRLAFYLVAAASIVTAALVFALGRDPSRSTEATELLNASAQPQLSTCSALADAGRILRVRSFAVILAQGAVGSMPWYAMGFMTLYFEEKGLSHHEAARARAMLDAGAAVGILLGGVLNDAAAIASPSHGRVLVAQFSVFSGIPIFMAIFYVLPASACAGAMLLAGILIQWCGGVNNTIMAEVTPPSLRTTIYGLDRMLEGVVAPAGGLLAGWLAESAFGYQLSSGCANATDSHANSSTTMGDEGANAAALGEALAVSMCVPWTLCFIAYTAMHCVYAADRRAMLAMHEVGEQQQASGDDNPLPRHHERRRSHGRTAGWKELELPDISTT